MGGQHQVCIVEKQLSYGIVGCFYETYNELLGYAAEAVTDWDSFIELVNYLYEHPEEVRTDDRVLRDLGHVQRKW